MDTIPLEKPDQEPVQHAENSNLSNLVEEYLPEGKSFNIILSQIIQHGMYRIQTDKQIQRKIKVV